VNIDWDAVNGIVARAPKPPTFSDDQIAAAVAAIGSLPAKGNDPDVVKTLWDRPKHMPGIDEVDFRDVKYPKLTIATLKASNKTLSRTRLVWHVQNPGVALHPGPFTTNPIVLGKKSGLDSIRIKAAELGLDVPEERSADVLAAVKKLGAAQEALAGCAMKLLMWFQTGSLALVPLFANRFLEIMLLGQMSWPCALVPSK